MPVRPGYMGELGRLMQGDDWILNEGAGTEALRREQRTTWGWTTVAGIAMGMGVDGNAERSVEFVKERMGPARILKNESANHTVNLAGHSRGSITCFKIANRLQQDPITRGCTVNIFAIDPVAGNTGAWNSSSYKQITLLGKVAHARMIMAESERRNAFRPYIDQIFLSDDPAHELDTIPGNHGGINELGRDRLSE